jgi:hypothetical protein
MLIRSVAVLLTWIAFGASLSAATPSCVFEMDTRVPGAANKAESTQRFGGLVIEIKEGWVAALVPRLAVDLEHPSGIYQGRVEMTALRVIEDGRKACDAQLSWLPRWDATEEWAVIRFKARDDSAYEVFQPADAGSQETIQLRFGAKNLFSSHTLTAKQRSLTRADLTIRDPEINAFAEDGTGAQTVPWGTLVLNQEGKVIGMWLPTDFLAAFDRLKTSLRMWGAVQGAGDEEALKAARGKALGGLASLVAGLATGHLGLIGGGVLSIATADAESAGSFSKIVEANIKDAQTAFKDSLASMLIGFTPWTKLQTPKAYTHWWDELLHMHFKLPNSGWVICQSTSQGSIAHFTNEAGTARGEHRLLSAWWTRDEALENTRAFFKKSVPSGAEASYTEEKVSVSATASASGVEWIGWKVAYSKEDQIVSRRYFVAGLLNNTVMLFSLESDDMSAAKKSLIAIASTIEFLSATVTATLESGDFSDLARVDKDESGGPEIRLGVYSKDLTLVKSWGDPNVDKAAFPKKQDDAKPAWSHTFTFEYRAGDTLRIEGLEEDFLTSTPLFNLASWNEEKKAGSALFLFGAFQGPDGPRELEGTHDKQKFKFKLTIRHNYYHRQLAR